VVWVRSTDYVAWWNLVNLFGAGPVPGAGNRDVAGETLSYFHQRELIGPKIWWRSLAREEEQGGPREPGERLAVEA
jgi:hypothetical protein